MADEGYALIQRDATTGDQTTQTSIDGQTWTTTDTVAGTAPVALSLAPTDVSYQNTWSSYGGGWRGANYSKSGNVVNINGVVKTSAATPTTAIFTLPSGFRPSAALLFSVTISNTTIGTVSVSTAGVVKHESGTIAATTGFMVLSFTFYADGS